MTNKEASPNLMLADQGARPISTSTSYYADGTLGRNAEKHTTSLKQKLSSWILAFGEDLLWMGFLEEGRPLHCIENPDAAQEEP